MNDSCLNEVRMKSIRATVGITMLLAYRVALAEWDGRGYHSDGPGGLSLTILFLGALHAFPVLIIAMISKSKIITLLIAVASAAFAVMVGGAAYAVVDLLFVGIGTYAAFKIHLNSD